jgi:hypothetical protein
MNSAVNNMQNNIFFNLETTYIQDISIYESYNFTYLFKNDLLNNNLSYNFFFNNDKNIQKQKNEENEKKSNIYKNKLLNSINSDEFEYGTASNSEILFKEMLKQDRLVAKDAIQKVWISNYSKMDILCGVLRIIAHIEYKELNPQNIIIVTSAIAHKDEEITECAIRCCENWENAEVLNILNNIKCTAEWLNDYLNHVKSEISRNLS